MFGRVTITLGIGQHSSHMFVLHKHISDSVDFGTLRSFKRTIKLVDFSQFLKCF